MGVFTILCSIVASAIVIPSIFSNSVSMTTQLNSPDQIFLVEQQATSGDPWVTEQLSLPPDDYPWDPTEKRVMYNMRVTNQGEYEESCRLQMTVSCDTGFTISGDQVIDFAWIDLSDNYGWNDNILSSWSWIQDGDSIIITSGNYNIQPGVYPSSGYFTIEVNFNHDAHGNYTFDFKAIPPE